MIREGWVFRKDFSDRRTVRLRFRHRFRVHLVRRYGMENSKGAPGKIPRAPAIVHQLWRSRKVWEQDDTNDKGVQDQGAISSYGGPIIFEIRTKDICKYGYARLKELRGRQSLHGVSGHGSALQGVLPTRGRPTR